ncbi:MAG TPA: H-type small acid-soluble spore protein [Paenibacillus sp.]|uniref:H-type small acid-soluble spore protein n=1 Tax=Paenibacillus sp. TaxID=58172 RepID=UPI002C018172|nr:H-type small acid-soluble spore protein [Paenibacillus sp.]HUC92264.1 H-type small acid-soluble spore protein [Paenibacillus sp.]
MNVERAMQIYSSKDTYPVHLEGRSVWIENVDEDNGMATVQIGSDPLNTHTVSVERLSEPEHRERRR